MIALFALVTTVAVVIVVILLRLQAHYSQIPHDSGIRYSVFSEGPTPEYQSIGRMVEKLASISYSFRK